MRQKELIDLYILEILSEYASQDKPMYQEEIMSRLEYIYEMKVSRKTLSGYLACLREKGYIKGKRGVYKVNKFSDDELRVLIDSVLYAQYIPKQEAEELIEKLKGLSPVSLKDKLRNTHYVQAVNRTQNDNLYLVLDEIDQAIQENKKVEITRCLYNVDGKLEDVEKRIIHPYYIVTSNSRYYVICRDEKMNILTNKRIDRISEVEILNARRKPIGDISGYGSDFNLGTYMKEHVYMFSGKSIPITIKMQKRHIGFFIDWYGNDYTWQECKEDADYMIIRTRNNENASYYWALQYGGMVEVLAPLSLRTKIKEGLDQIRKKYD